MTIDTLASKARNELHVILNIELGYFRFKITYITHTQEMLIIETFYSNKIIVARYKGNHLINDDLIICKKGNVVHKACKVAYDYIKKEVR